ncbi:hypothetical protein RB653_006996 [Dictyostelium firmibasis]|uniref:Uncharacterized protein n=1 Tax=Dictyostelium firmibasis TaxID=79012 RepID=A0AAN7TTW2_9MYCE
MRSILSLLIVILSFVALSKALDCGHYKNPLTCAGVEPPCFWNGKECTKIYPKHCSTMTNEECQNNKEKGCYFEGEKCILSKFHCSSIHNEFDCTIENCVWKGGKCEN